MKWVYVGVITQSEKFESPPCLIGLRQTVLQERKEADALSEQERARIWVTDSMKGRQICVDGVYGGTPCVDGRDVDSLWICIRSCLHKMTLSKTEKTLRVVCNAISVWCLVGGLSLIRSDSMITLLVAYGNLPDEKLKRSLSCNKAKNYSSCNLWLSTTTTMRTYYYYYYYYYYYSYY